MTVPPLPDPPSPETLRTLDEAALADIQATLKEAEGAVLAAMAPHQKALGEIRARHAELATERRRRERSQHLARRIAVRQGAASGELPSLVSVLAAADVPGGDDPPLTAVKAFLRTGGAVGFGFPTRPGTVSFTDGRRARQARTLGEARTLYAEGWEPGAAGVPGVRVHLTGTRVERVVPAEDVVIELAGC